MFMGILGVHYYWSYDLCAQRFLEYLYAVP